MYVSKDKDVLKVEVYFYLILYCLLFLDTAPCSHVVERVECERCATSS